jgi:hypothetical protein
MPTIFSSTFQVFLTLFSAALKISITVSLSSVMVNKKERNTGMSRTLGELLGVSKDTSRSLEARENAVSTLLFLTPSSLDLISLINIDQFLQLFVLHIFVKTIRK